MTTIVVVRRQRVKIYRNIILSGVLYACENWSLTLRKERRLRMFENTALEGKIWALEGSSNRGIEITT
jgi:hypothetical protein